MVLILLSAGLVFADINEVGERAQDVWKGTFGSDENITTNVIFMNPVYFMDRLLSYSNPNYFINFSGGSQLNELGLNNLDVNYTKIHNNLNVTTSSGRAIWAKSTNNDAVAGETTASGKSAIYGWAATPNAYSGYFDGGQFYINSYPITLADSHFKNCGKLYTDANGNVTCGSETDPQVGQTTSGKWCTGTGSQVTCNQNPPVTSETDPQVGQTTSGKWCTGTGSQVTCNQNPPVTSETDPQVGQTTNSDVCYGTGTQTTCNNNNLYWDSSNNRLGIGTSNPQVTLDVNGIIRESNQPTASNDVATKAYVDAAVVSAASSGLEFSDDDNDGAAGLLSETGKWLSPYDCNDTNSEIKIARDKTCDGDSDGYIDETSFINHSLQCSNILQEGGDLNDNIQGNNPYNVGNAADGTCDGDGDGYIDFYAFTSVNHNLQCSNILQEGGDLDDNLQGNNPLNIGNAADGTCDGDGDGYIDISAGGKQGNCHILDPNDTVSSVTGAGLGIASDGSCDGDGDGYIDKSAYPGNGDSYCDYDDNHAGSFSGYGCGSCPFGTFQNNGNTYCADPAYAYGTCCNSQYGGDEDWTMEGGGIYCK